MDKSVQVCLLQTCLVIPAGYKNDAQSCYASGKKSLDFACFKYSVLLYYEIFWHFVLYYW